MATYYVSAAGNDSNAGTSVGAPWLSVAKVAAGTFAAGDSILFRSGDTFAGFLYLNASRVGTAADPVTYGSYGTGRATLTSTTTGVFIDGVAGVVVRDLILNGGTNTSDGINFFKSTAGRARGITVINCDVSGYYNGISVGGSGGGGFDTIAVTNCDTHANKSNGLFFYGPTFVPATPVYAHSNVYVGRCRSFSNTGDSAVTASSTGSGILLGSVDSAVVEYCAANSNGASCPSATGPVGIWTYDSNNVIIKNCVSYSNSTGTGNADGDGFDIDIDCTNCVVEYCLSYNNFGSGILVFGSAGNTAHNNNTVRYNLCWGNVRSSIVYHGEITVAGKVSNCAIYNNTLVALDNAAATKPAPVSLRDTNAQNVTIRNNILYQSGTGTVAITPAALTAANALFQGNNYFSLGTLSISWNSVSYTTLVAWRAAIANQEVVSGVNTGLTSDPAMVSPATSPTVTDPSLLGSIGGLKLQAASVAKTAGLDIFTKFGTATGSQDYFGYRLNVPYSIGAHTGGALTPQQITNSGATPNYIPATIEGDTFDPVGNSFLYITNGGGGSLTVTVVSAKTALDGLAISNRVWTIPAGTSLIAAFIDAQRSATTGLVSITYSTTTSVTIRYLNI